MNKNNEDQSRLKMEKSTAQDYFKFEKENDCVPFDEELNYYCQVISAA